MTSCQVHEALFAAYCFACAPYNHIITVA